MDIRTVWRSYTKTREASTLLHLSASHILTIGWVLYIQDLPLTITDRCFKDSIGNKILCIAYFKRNDLVQRSLRCWSVLCYLCTFLLDKRNTIWTQV